MLFFTQIQFYQQFVSTLWPLRTESCKLFIQMKTSADNSMLTAHKLPVTTCQNFFLRFASSVFNYIHFLELFVAQHFYVP
jgi:hypothetical protein